MENAPHVIETALLLLVAFLVGCTIGWFFRTKVFAGSKQPATDAPTQSAQPVQTPGSKSNARSEDTTATPVPVTAPESDTPEASQSVASKAAATTKSTASQAAKSQPAKPKTAVKRATKSKATAAKLSDAGADANRPEALSGPRAGGKDDLKKISGIGPKLEEKLNGLGIFHFDQIVAWDRPAVEWVDNYLSFKGRIDRDDWIAQAKEFANQ